MRQLRQSCQISYRKLTAAYAAATENAGFVRRSKLRLARHHSLSFQRNSLPGNGFNASPGRDSERSDSCNACPLLRNEHIDLCRDMIAVCNDVLAVDN